MHFFDHFDLWGGWLIHNGPPFAFVLGIVVFFHELGHFLVARWCGVRVLTFSIGFGPELFGFYDRHGTRWKISLVLLGGYVKFFGDENAASAPDQALIATMDEADRRVSFFHQRVASRAAIVAAGPVANFILAIVVFTALFMIYGKQITSARVDVVQPDSPAATAGFKPGDTVVEINHQPIASFSEMQRIVSASAGDTIEVVVERGGTQVVLKAIPALREVKDNFGNVRRIGVLGIQRSPAPGDIRRESVGPLVAMGLGVQETWSIVDQTFAYLGRVVGGRESADQVGGPIAIMRASGQMASLGFDALLSFAAMLSVSIGLLNLFPIPLLDGGHLLFYGIEAVRGRPLSERAHEIGFRIGLAIVLLLMIFATYNDIRHAAGS